MKKSSVCLLLASIFVFSALAEERSGTITASAKVSSNGTANIVDMQSTLPEKILEQLKPAFSQRALEAYAEEELSEEREYRMIMDWKVIEQDGKEQLSFDWRNNDVVPIVTVQPAMPREVKNVRQDVTIRLEFTVLEDGGVTDVIWVNQQNRFRTAFENAKAALEQWKFKPRMIEGVAKERRATMSMTYDDPVDEPDEEDAKMLFVNFRFDSDGQPHKFDYWRDGFSPAIPECLIEVKIEAAVLEKIRNSSAAQAVRSGESDLRRGSVRYELPECGDPEFTRENYDPETAEPEQPMHIPDGPITRG